MDSAPGWLGMGFPSLDLRSLRRLEAAHFPRTNTGQMQTKPNRIFFSTACTPYVELHAPRLLLFCFYAVFYPHRSKNPKETFMEGC